MRPPRPIPVTAVLTAATHTLAGCTTAGGGASAGGAPLPANAPSLGQAYVSMVSRVLPSVVQITTDHDLGSGVVLDGKGDIVTNAHVVDSTKLQVRLAGSAGTYPANLVGSYPPDALAVVHLDSPPSGLRPAHVGDCSKLAIGEIVLAIGNPLGLTSTVTNGIVSGPGRTVTEPQGGGSPGVTLPDAIQTSAAINPGNSGGALVDLAGDVIGIPTLAAIDTQIGGSGGSAAPGIGFAISSNLVTDVAGQLVATGHVTNSHRAELGVQVATVLDPNGAPTGVGIGNVIPGGPAAAAGLQAGEVITVVNNTPVTLGQLPGS